MKTTQPKHLLRTHEAGFEDVVENLEPTGFETCCVGSGDVLAEVIGEILIELSNEGELDEELNK